MKVILQDDITGLGEEGDICDVTPGYARNYLFRKTIAVPYSKHEETLLGNRHEAIQKRKEEKRLQAASVIERIEAESLSFSMAAGETGKLFGSITTSSISQELAKRGITVDRKRIEIPNQSLRNIGEYNIRIRLYENQSAKLKVLIESSSN